MIEWNDIKFRASSWGSLLTEPVTKADKEAGKLSKTCQMELIKIYNQEVYGRRKDITTAAMDKGKQCEQDAINLLSMIDGELYCKNEERLESEWFSGCPDIFIGGSIHNADLVGDIKCSFELDTFTPKYIDEIDRAYAAQLNVYYSLSQAKGGFLSYCLVDCPPNILESEKRSLLFKMNVATELAPEYVKAAKELEHLLIFSNDIPPEERVLKIEVERDDELIEKMKAKVPVLREWLHNFHEQRMKKSYKSTILA